MPTVTVTVDRISITVPTGTTVVDAARMGGIDIPVFCYHPKLKSVGMCRMCLVEIGTPKMDPATRQPMLTPDGQPVLAMMPKLQTGCTTPVSQGMVINTATPEVKFAQRGVLEFLLTSHPLDCPVCDKGGECPLQNLTMEWGPPKSRFDYDDKLHFEKPIPLGDLILLDRERCILCSRCVRFQDELADDPVLGFTNRGRKWMIISRSEPPFASKFSGNTTDICPVGALTSADFRFKARVWEVTPKPAVCTLCSVGCNLTLDMRHDQVMRVMPRENEAVNEIWLCDKGRFGQRFVGDSARLTTPLIRKGERLVEASWDEALRLVAEKLDAIQRAHGGQAIAGLAAPRLSNEDLYAFQKLFREQLGCNNLDHTTGAPNEGDYDELGAILGIGQGTHLGRLGSGTAVLVVGADPEEEAPLYLLRLRGMAQRGAKLIVAGLRPTKLERAASTVLRYKAGGEVAFARALLRAILVEVGTKRLTVKTSGLDQLRKTILDLAPESLAEAAGVSAASIEAAAKTFLEAENGIIVYGAEARSVGPALIETLGALAALAGKVGKANSGLLPLLSGGNRRGALDMGLRPDAYPGYVSSAERALSAREVWGAAQERRVRAVWLAGLDPVASLPAAQAALEATEFVVVQELFLTETAKLADVVLPAASFAERDGTYTNAERRVQRSRQACAPVGTSRPDWQIVQGVAQILVELASERAKSAPSATNGGKRAGAAAKGTNDAKSVSPVNAEAAAGGWDFTTPAAIAAEIAVRVPGYQGVTYVALAATGSAGTWGRQVNETFFYDGTSYANPEGVGIQLPSLIESGKLSLGIAPRPTPRQSEERPLLLLAQPLAYDGDPLLRGSLLTGQVPQPYVALSRVDAERQNVRSGDTVRLESAAGQVTLIARVVEDLPAGVAVAPALLPGFSLANVQTGPRTQVSLVKILV